MIQENVECASLEMLLPYATYQQKKKPSHCEPQASHKQATSKPLRTRVGFPKTTSSDLQKGKGVAIDTSTVDTPPSQRRGRLQRRDLATNLDGFPLNYDQASTRWSHLVSAECVKWRWRPQRAGNCWAAPCTLTLAAPPTWQASPHSPWCRCLSRCGRGRTPLSLELSGAEPQACVKTEAAGFPEVGEPGLQSSLLIPLLSKQRRKYLSLTRHLLRIGLVVALSLGSTREKAGLFFGRSNAESSSMHDLHPPGPLRDLHKDMVPLTLGTCDVKYAVHCYRLRKSLAVFVESARVPATRESLTG